MQMRVAKEKDGLMLSQLLMQAAAAGAVESAIAPAMKASERAEQARWRCMVLDLRLTAGRGLVPRVPRPHDRPAPGPADIAQNGNEIDHARPGAGFAQARSGGRPFHSPTREWRA